MKSSHIFLFLILISSIFLVSSCGGSGGNNEATENSSFVSQELNNDSLFFNPTSLYIDNTEVTDLVPTPNGKFVYARATNHDRYDGFIACFKWNNETNKYLFSTSCSLDINAWPLAVSPDGANLYYKTSEISTLFSMSLDSQNGIATFLSSLELDVDITNFYLRWGEKPLMSPNGKFLYFPENNWRRTAIFSRDSAGNLSYLQHQETIGRGSFGATFNSDGSLLFLAGGGVHVYSIDEGDGTLSHVDFFGGGASESYYGETRTGSFLYAAINNTKSELYVLVKGRNIDPSSYSIDLVVFEFSSQGELSYKYHHPVENFDSSNGYSAFAYSMEINESDSLVYIFKNKLNSYLKSTEILYTFSIQGNAGFELVSTKELRLKEGYGTMEFKFIPETNSLLLSGKPGGGLTVINTISDTINEQAVQMFSNEMNGLRSNSKILVHNQSNTVYTMTQNKNGTDGDHSLNAYRYITTNNTLELNQSFDFTSSYFLSLGRLVRSVEMSPDGNFLYAYGYAPLTGDDGIIVFSVDELGLLTKLEYNGLDYIDHIYSGVDRDWLKLLGSAISPDNRFFYTISKAASQRDGLSGHEELLIIIYERNLSTGNLTEVSKVFTNNFYTIELSNFRRVPILLIHPNGKYLYYLDKAFAKITIFERDSNSGSLTLVDEIQDGDLNGGSTVEGLIEVRSAAISNSGEYLYLGSDEMWQGMSLETGLPGNKVGIQVYKIDQSTGLLTRIQAVKRTGGGVSGLPFVSNANKYNILGGYREVVLSDDNQYLYGIVQGARSFNYPPQENTVAIDIFEIDSATGKISFLDRIDESVYGHGVSSIKSIEGTDHIVVTNERIDMIGFSKIN